MAAVVQVSLVVATVVRQAEPEVVHPVCAVQAAKANKSRVRQGMIRMQQVPHRTHIVAARPRASHHPHDGRCTPYGVCVQENPRLVMTTNKRGR